MVTTGSPTGTAACIVCHGRRFRLYRSIRSHLDAIPEGLDRGPDVDVTLSRCQDCGLLRLEAGEAEAVQRLYTDKSISYDASLSKLREPGDESIYSTDEFEFISRATGRLLDVGCSSGYFLRRAERRGWDVHGLDPDPRAVAYAMAELGLNVRCGTLSDAGLPADSFDVVTLWGVLEHLPDPAAQLRLANRVLRDGGELVVAVPYVRSLNRAVARLGRHDWDMLCEPGHLYHFDRRTLTRLVTQADFRAVRWGTATCAIRGKLPFSPWRVPRWERRIAALYSGNRTFRASYRLFLRALDRFRLGDVLVAAFVKA
jgi:2-polyprenyl-3-methyl-5-hydroxy-6-metoxy-1,4-benzoquinol methylase